MNYFNEQSKTKFIFITGGVCSSLGKGIASSSIGFLLESHGFSVSNMKMDPYINVDSGNLSIAEHGEIYVTSDGLATDLDLGNYFRYTKGKVSSLNSVTTGQIYNRVINRERNGGYNGKTVQVVPSITDEIKESIIKLYKSNSDVDFIIVEVGGTVGDIECFPFLESIRQLTCNDLDKSQYLHIHLTLIPALSYNSELKTKPTQHSVIALRSLGIQPDILLCRMNDELNNDIRSKLALFCSVDKSSVVRAVDVDNIYKIPSKFREEGLDKIILNKFNLESKDKSISYLNKLNEMLIKNKIKTIRIGIVGEYVDVPDGYYSLFAALEHSAMSNSVKVKLELINPSTINTNSNINSLVVGLDAIILCDSQSNSAFEGAILIAEYLRKNNIKTIGINLGLHIMCVEYARNELNIKNATSSEFSDINPASESIIVHNINSYITNSNSTAKECGLKIGSIKNKRRIGTSEINIVDEDNHASKIYSNDISKDEILNHRFFISPEHLNLFNDKNFKVTGYSTIVNGIIISEIMELKKHSLYLGIQFYTEYKSKIMLPSPIFNYLLKSMI